MCLSFVCIDLNCMSVSNIKYEVKNEVSVKPTLRMHGDWTVEGNQENQKVIDCYIRSQRSYYLQE